MRLLPCCALVVVLAACGADPEPHAVAPSSPDKAVPPAAQAVSADPGLAPVAATASTAECERAAQHATDTVAQLLAAAADADVTAQGRAPKALLALGEAALPGLAKGLAHENVTQRRIAAMTLLQWTWQPEKGASDPVVQALAAARNDQDPAVRAAAEHAWRRATGDTSALDLSRAAHQAAERR